LLFWFAFYELFTPKEAVQAFRELVMNRRNPDLDEFQVLEAFKRNGLTQTANYLRALV
jgi:hypothetical protein